ncbi:MAG: ureidoglycolate lyase [Tahibacter sp.]
MKSEGSVLRVERLTLAAFAPFGDVIESAAAKTVYPINAGTATRYHDLAQVDTATQDGRPLISLFRAEPRTLPFDVRLVERHPLGSQAFVPLNSDQTYLVVVTVDPAQTPRAFLASHGQGVNYRRGTWHHPLIALHRVSDFLVIDRGGSGTNCDEVALFRTWRIDDATIGTD